MNRKIKTVAELRELLEAKRDTFGESAPIHMFVDGQLYAVSVQINPKGKLGPGSVLLTPVGLAK